MRILNTPIQEAKFLDRETLLDKNQKYPIPAGIYEEVCIKTFIDKRGVTIKVVTLLPHQHTSPACSCSCNTISHNWVEGAYVKNYDALYCYRERVCTYCGQKHDIPFMIEMHTFELSKDMPIRTCIVCGTVEQLPLRVWEILTGQNTLLENRVSPKEWNLLRQYEKGMDAWSARVIAYKEITFLEATSAQRVLNPESYTEFNGLLGIMDEQAPLQSFFITKKGEVFLIKRTIQYLGKDTDGEELNDYPIASIEKVSLDETLPKGVFLLKNYMQKDPHELQELIRKYNLMMRAKNLRRSWSSCFKAKYNNALKDVLTCGTMLPPKAIGRELWRLLATYETGLYALEEGEADE